MTRGFWGTVGTTCGSGWVRSQVATDLFNTSVRATHPPATAGGTDRVQQTIVSLEAKSKQGAHEEWSFCQKQLWGKNQAKAGLKFSDDGSCNARSVRK